MRNIESQTQQACVRYFRLQYPRYAGCFFSVPNGGRRDTVTGAILKAEGALAGVADLFLSVPNNVHHGLYVEMKTRKGRQQDSQKAFQKAVEAQGYRYEICRSLDDFITLIKDYLYQMRRLRARQASQGSGRMVRDTEHRKGSELFPVL